MESCHSRLVSSGNKWTMEKEGIDVAVLILFFNRAEPLAKLFEQVRKARPTRLFLYQDGPRSKTDMAGIEACRRVVETVDWPCEVHRSYQTENRGCDPSNYLAQRWAFSLADKCIVFEDDDVPAVSFFRFCKELLDRYENDPRVEMISGFNAEEVTDDVDSDYFFTQTFSIWGWASWRRVIERWDEQYSFLDNPEAVARLEALIRQRRMRRDLLPMCRDHKALGKPFYETIFWTDMLLHNALAIMPKRNLVNNLGPIAQSTHYAADLQTMPRRLRRMFTMPRYELSFPLHHPRYMIEHVEYKNRLYKINAWQHPFIKIMRSFEELWLNLRRGRLAVIHQSIKRRIRKWMGKEHAR